MRKLQINTPLSMYGVNTDAFLAQKHVIFFSNLLMFLYKMHLLVYCVVYLIRINCIQISLRLIYLIFWTGFLSPQWSSWQRFGLAIQRSRVRSPEGEAPEKGRKKFDAGRFSFMVILKPWVSTFKVWIVFSLEQNFLVKSILTGCGTMNHMFS